MGLLKLLGRKKRGISANERVSWSLKCIGARRIATLYYTQLGGNLVKVSDSDSDLLKTTRFLGGQNKDRAIIGK